MDAHNKFSGTVIGNAIQGRDITVFPPAAFPVATQGLPAQPIFVGRDTELAQLANLLNPAAAHTLEAPVIVSAVAGLAGVGKTTLAVRAAHDAITAGWFPGGVLMVDLRGYDPPERRVQPTDALASLLGALGTPGEHIPLDQADRERLWRSLLANRHATGRRMLILLDNASSAGQVHPLLPGPGGHRVLITSRHSLADLGGARLLDIDVLPADHAVKLLQQELATAHPYDNRIHCNPDAANQLAALCGGLPLALRITAARLAADPDQSVTELVETLTAEHLRLEELDYDGSLNVRAAFDLSYQHLAPGQARLFRLLGLNPGADIGTEAAAALVGAGTPETRRMIGHLRRAHLVQPGAGRSRWRMHDLLRLYAAEQAEKDDQQCEVALDRLLHYYVTTSKAASGHLDTDAKLDSERRLTGRKNALVWFDTEYTNLNAALVLAYNTERYAQTVALADALHKYFTLHLHLQARDWIATHQIALVAARKIGNREAEGRIQKCLGTAFMRSSFDNEAERHHQQALEIFRELDNRHGEADAMLGLGWAVNGHDRDEEAAYWFRQALAIYREIGDPFGEVRALNGLGQNCEPEEGMDCYHKALEIKREHGDWAAEAFAMGNLAYYHLKLGRWTEALRYHLQALDMWDDLKDHPHQVHQTDVNRRIYGEAQTLYYLGQTYRRLDQFDRAIICYQQCARMQRELGSVEGVAHALADLGDTYRDTGRLGAAIAYWREALDLFTELNIAYTRTDQLRAALAATNPTA